MALVNCPECAREISTAAPACPHCGYPIAATPNETTPVTNQSPQQQETKGGAPEINPTQAAPTAPPAKTNVGKGCMGCLGIVVLLVLIGWIGEMAGCNKPTQTEVGSSGADVAFVNAVGQATGESATLAPGTKLKWDHDISDTYAVYEVMSGPYNNRWARIERDKVTER